MNKKKYTVFVKANLREEILRYTHISIASEQTAFSIRVTTRKT